MDQFKICIEKLNKNPRNWLITGVAGFIGSNLLETLLRANQKVVGLDNFSTGHQSNLDDVRSLVTEEQWNKFILIKGDIRNIEDCNLACKDINYVLHQAALGSVPRSIEDPLLTNEVNCNGFLKLMQAAKNSSCQKFIFASSSSVYGDHPALPKKEGHIGSPLSPYAVSKRTNELYAQAFGAVYGTDFIGLRYFNVFGPRQDARGQYSAVIPIWINSILNGKNVYLNGDGSTSRDFCYIQNVVEANILAATNQNIDKEIMNIAVGQKISLKELFNYIKNQIHQKNVNIPTVQFEQREFRSGDVLHSLADIGKAVESIGYQPKVNVYDGLKLTIDWFLKNSNDQI